MDSILYTLKYLSRVKSNPKKYNLIRIYLNYKIKNLLKDYN